MAKTFESIDERLKTWIAQQSMFFVGTAPIDSEGHVNVSPKGPIGTFGVLAPRRVAYLDFFGSGAETIAHLRENGRIVIMFCAFGGPPRILRLHGIGRPVWPTDPEFAEVVDAAGLHGLTDVEQARRAVILVDVDRISDSCGYGVPLMQPVGEREHYDLSKRKRLRTSGAEGLAEHQSRGNRVSVDGLPAVPERM